MTNTDIKKDFGIVEAAPNINIYRQIKRYMEANGFNVETNDICSVNEQNDGVVLFKFVHYSVPTMESEPYYKIKFITKDKGMKDTIKRLEKEEKDTREKLKKITNAIESLQEVCDHKHSNGEDAFVSDGHDSHKNYYKCEICGKTESV